jgi:thioredoxin 2
MGEDDDIATCPHCGTRNRIHPSPGGSIPVCGKCKNSLPWVVVADDATFQNEVKAPVVVLVDFWAAWCAPCKIVAPVLEQLARDRAGKLKVVKMDVDNNPATAGQFLVRSIPTMILFKNGQVVDTFVGAMPKGELLRRISPHL